MSKQQKYNREDFLRLINEAQRCIDLSDDCGEFNDAIEESKILDENTQIRKLLSEIRIAILTTGWTNNHEKMYELLNQINKQLAV